MQRCGCRGAIRDCAMTGAGTGQAVTTSRPEERAEEQLLVHARRGT